VVRGAFGIYYDGVVGLLFSNPPPYTPTRFYSTGPSWEGPWDFVGVWSFESLTANVDPELRSPHTLQYSLGVEREFSSVYSVGATLVQGLQRRDRLGDPG
jgi:hypothetical protein